MKRVEIVVSGDDVNKIEEILRSSEFLYSKLKTETNDTPTATYQLLVPEEVLDDLIANLSNRIDLRKKESMVTVYDVGISISRFLERMQQKERKDSSVTHPLEAIIQPLERYKHLNKDIVLMMMLSTLIALFGLFLNNITIVIGAMLISPMLGPINSISVNACLGKAKVVAKEELLMMSMLAASILFAAACTFIASQVFRLPLTLTDQITTRTQVTDIDVAVSLFLGVAGGMAIVSALPEILVGVAVAAALVPPMAVVGLGIGLGDTGIIIGALLLTLSNFFGLKAGSILALLSKGVSPRKYYERQKARKYGIYLLFIFLIIVLIMATLINFAR